MQISKKLFSALSLLILIFLVPPFVQATPLSTEDNMSYEEIIKDLSREQHRAAAPTSRAQSRISNNSLDNVRIHGGVGFAQMFGSVNYQGSTTHLAQRGIQAALGIDLFSENLMAEGTARNFSSQEYRGTHISLKEFDLKLIYLNRFAPKLGFKLGGGLAARYMHISRNGSSQDYTTPSSVLAGGLQLMAAKNLAFGAEISNRASLIGETIDRNSYDVTLRIDANF